MKKYVFYSVTTLLLTMFCQSAVFSQVVNRVLAVVNGEIITSQEFEEYYLQAMAQGGFGRGLDPTMQDSARSQFLDAMINDILLRQEAERLKVDVTDSEVENEMKQFKVRRRLTDEEFNHSLKLQGMTPEQFKIRTKQELMKNRMLGFMVRRKVVITEEEVAAFFEQHRSQFMADRKVSLQMLVLNDENEAISVRKALESTQLSFDDAVHSRSLGPQENQGTIEEVRWKELALDWREALDTVPIGGLTQPFPVQGKWVILKVLDHKQGTDQGLKDVQDDVREAIMRPKLEERFQEYMSDLRSKALIEKRL